MPKKKKPEEEPKEEKKEKTLTKEELIYNTCFEMLRHRTPRIDILAYLIAKLFEPKQYGKLQDLIDSLGTEKDAHEFLHKTTSAMVEADREKELQRRIKAGEIPDPNRGFENKEYVYSEENDGQE